MPGLTPELSLLLTASIYISLRWLFISSTTPYQYKWHLMKSCWNVATAKTIQLYIYVLFLSKNTQTIELEPLASISENKRYLFSSSPLLLEYVLEVERLPSLLGFHQLNESTSAENPFLWGKLEWSQQGSDDTKSNTPSPNRWHDTTIKAHVSLRL